MAQISGKMISRSRFMIEESSPGGGCRGQGRMSNLSALCGLGYGKTNWHSEVSEERHRKMSQIFPFLQYFCVHVVSWSHLNAGEEWSVQTSVGIAAPVPSWL